MNRGKHTVILGLVFAFTLAVFASCGGGGSGAVGVLPKRIANAPVYSRFAYAVNDQDGTISIYAVDAASGNLRQNGYMPVGGNNPRALAVDPTNKFLFVSNHGASSGIRTYKIDPASGALSLSSTLGSAIAYSMASDPTGSFLYAAGFSGAQNVLACSIDPTTGALTAAPGSPYTAGNSPAAISVHPSGKYVYVANSGSDDISSFTVNAADGSLVSSGSVSAGSFPNKLAMDPKGSFLFAVNANSGNVSAYRIGQGDGALTEIAGSPFTTGIGFATSIAVSQSGSLVYLTDMSGSVVAFEVDPKTGALSTAAGFPVSAGTTPWDVVADASGEFLYVVNYGSDDLSAFKIDPVSGSLTSQGRTSARKVPYALVLTKGSSPVVYKPTFAYAANALDGTISQYSIGADGALASLATDSVPAGAQPRSVAADPSGKFVYAANFLGNSISAYAVDPNTGELTEVSGSPYTAGTSPTAVRVDPSGRFVYATNYGWPSPGSVSAYAIDPVSGALTPVSGSPFVAGPGSSSLAVDPAGRFVYVSNLLNDTVTAFSINSATGALSQIDFDTVTAGMQDLTVTNARPVAIRVDPTGRFTYLETACGNPWVFTINSASGTLTRVDSDPGGLCGATPDAADSISADPWGRYLYTVNYGTADSVSVFAISSANGSLTAVSGSPFIVQSNASSVTIDPSGKYAYTAHASSNSAISQYSIGADGALASLPTPTVPSGGYPQSITTIGTMQ